MGRIWGVLALAAACGFAASCSSGSHLAAQTTTVPADETSEEAPPPPPIGDSCLIGRWVTEVQQLNAISFNDEKVPVSGAAGYVITFTAAGTELQDANNSQPLIGSYHGGQLSVVQRGQGSFIAHADGQQIVESGPDQPFALAFSLNGDPQDTFTSANTPGTSSYTCDDNTLVVTGGATPQDRQVLARS